MTNNFMSRLWTKQAACTALQIAAQAVGDKHSEPRSSREKLALQADGPAYDASLRHAGRQVQQVPTFRYSPTPPAPASGAGGYAVFSTSAVVISDGAACGACDSDVDTALDKVAAASTLGVQSILFDLRADAREYSVDNSEERLDEIRQLVNASTHAYHIRNVVLGLSKDDVTMFTPGRPELDGVPTAASQSVMATLATAFKAEPAVSLYFGGQPQNPVGALNAEIDGIYDQMITAVRKAGFQHKIILSAPQDYGRNLSYYERHPKDSALFNGPEFMVTLQDPGDESQTDGWIQQGFGLRKSFIIGERADSGMDSHDAQADVVRRLAMIAGQGGASYLTPFAGDELAGCSDQVPLLSANLCNSTGPIIASAAGSVFLQAQKNTVLG